MARRLPYRIVFKNTYPSAQDILDVLQFELRRKRVRVTHWYVEEEIIFVDKFDETSQQRFVVKLSYNFF